MIPEHCLKIFVLLKLKLRTEGRLGIVKEIGTSLSQDSRQDTLRGSKTCDILTVKRLLAGLSEAVIDETLK